MGEQENGPGVGALLRASRIRCGKDLRDMAQILRIRSVYIEAIEDGRFQDLPGITYSVGFIRAYAEHLGLDSEKVVKRFKAESRNIKGAPNLQFPILIAESSFPGGAVLFVGTLVAVLAYGGWYASTTMDDFFIDMVPPIPERLAILLREDGPIRQNYETGNRMGGSQESLSSPVTATAATPLRKSPPSPRTAVEPPADPGPQSEADKEAAAHPRELTASDEGSDSLPEKDRQSKQSLPAGNGVGEEVAAGTPDPENTASNGMAETIRADQVFGADNAGSRILVRAKSNSWVQVRDDIGKQLMLTRLLRPGDSYRVPDRPGLKLLTGNAGALEILVDGKIVPSIGSMGTVRHGISLDVERLREGTAVQN